MNKVSFSYPLVIPAYIGARLIALPPSLGCRSTLVRQHLRGVITDSVPAWMKCVATDLLLACSILVPATDN